VLDINLPNGTVRVNSTTYNVSLQDELPLWRAGGGGYAADGPYFLAGGRNNLLAIGCNVQVILLGEQGTLVSSCSPFCLEGENRQSFGICSGIFCSQAIILEARPSYTFQIEYIAMTNERFLLD
jgi:hypothetical protein